MTGGTATAKYRQAGITAEGLREELGEGDITLADALASGYTSQELYDGGYSAKELRAAGVTAANLQQCTYVALHTCMR